MQISRFLRNGESLALTHLSTPFRKIPGTFHHPPLLSTRISHTNTICGFFRMSSNFEDGSSPKWTSQHVRDAFLNYFKENGHTFGMLRSWCCYCQRERKPQC